MAGIRDKQPKRNFVSLEQFEQSIAYSQALNIHNFLTTLDFQRSSDWKNRAQLWLSKRRIFRHKYPSLEQIGISIGTSFDLDPQESRVFGVTLANETYINLIGRSSFKTRRRGEVTENEKNQENWRSSVDNVEAFAKADLILRQDTDVQKQFLNSEYLQNQLADSFGIIRDVAKDLAGKFFHETDEEYIASEFIKGIARIQKARIAMFTYISPVKDLKRSSVFKKGHLERVK